ncbi:MAG: amino acid ABC transporter permease [Clostridia bacterium]|nr:amino acid ABC transporter permease [Clostridia bacterium]
MTVYALLIGVVIGIVIAVIRSTWDLNSSRMKNPVGKFIFSILNKIAVIYTTVLRGTPMVIQLLILYYVVFAWSSEGLLVASLSFGLNSGAYVAEIFRGGIMSIDKGQFEAGNSLGFNYIQTMWYIIAPQMFKNVLPTLANEFIVLLKETSIAGYATVNDLTYAGNRIRGVTYSPFMPLIAVALIYLGLVMILTHFVGKLERRLRQSDNR